MYQEYMMCDDERLQMRTVSYGDSNKLTNKVTFSQ